MMVIAPKVRGFICTTAHPTGCEQHVKQQAQYVANQPSIKGPKNVLIIGSSTGYGLASRIVASVAAKAKTLGVAFEKPASGKRTASAGWYNTAAVENIAKEQQVYAKSINGDAFSDEIKQQAIDLIKKDLGKIDLIIYSLASPRRIDPESGEAYSSVLKTTSEPFHSKTVNPITGEISEVDIDIANQDEINHTVKVMGGEDWMRWITALKNADVLAEGVKTVAYSYIGPKITYPIYREGSIGRAKSHLEQTAHELTKQLQDLNGEAYISVNKAVVTQSSAAIPVVPLYISLLFKIMKEKNIHEDCIEQMYRLFHDKLYHGDNIETDDQGLIRLDDLEMRDDVQNEIVSLWQQATTENLPSISDIQGYRHAFYQLFGFGLSDINYDEEVNPEVAISSID